MSPPPLHGMTRRLGLVDACVDDFLEFLAVEKGASGNTIAAYRNDLSQLEAFVATRGNGSAVQWGGGGNAAAHPRGDPPPPEGGKDPARPPHPSGDRRAPGAPPPPQDAGGEAG